MKQQLSKEEQEKERIIKYAASLGVNLTVIDRPSAKNLFPEKLEEANRILANTKHPDKK
jgi:hypothetical protein